MPTTPASLADINLWDKDRFVEGVPHEWFERLRREAPVCWHEGDPDFDGPQGGAGPFWCVTGYDEVVTVNRDNALYSSAERLVFMWDPDDASLEQQRLLMLNMDPPLHTRYRRLINKGFTPRMVGELESTMRKRTSEIIDQVADQRRVRLRRRRRVGAAAPGDRRPHGRPAGGPAQAVRLVEPHDRRGRPRVRRHRGDDAATRRWSCTRTRRSSPSRSGPTRRTTSSRCSPPRQVDGEQLTGLEIDLFFLLLSVAGNETTRNLISHGLVALLEHPEQLERVRNDRSLVPGAVEEMLRWASPVMHFRRTATTDTELGGQQIKAGDKVVIWYIAANYDDKAFDDPYTFDIDAHAERARRVRRRWARTSASGRTSPAWRST